MPSPLELAYLAGIVDADGHITVNRSTRGDRVYYGAVIGISGATTTSSARPAATPSSAPEASRRG